MATKKSTAVVQPNLGIYFDRARIALNPRMLQDGLNFRVKDGLLTNLNMGWDRFGTFTLNGPVMAIITFTIRGGSEKLVFITLKDIYQYVNDTTVTYITPRYETGTVSRAGTTVTGVGTSFLANVKAGDQIHFGNAGEVATGATWDTVTLVTDNTHLTTLGTGVVGSGNYTIRKLFQTDQIENVWQADIFVNASPSTQDELWMTNGIDPIVRWNGSDTKVEDMTAQIGFTAKTLRVFDNMMIFANVVQGGTSKPTDFLNSNVGEPQNVGSLSSGISNQFKAHPGVEEILRLEPLGDNLAIYSKFNRVTMAQFLGDDIIFFAFRQISTSIGILAANLVANFGPYHEFLAPDSQYYFDGASIKPDNTHVWRELLRRQDPGRIQIGYSHFDQENGDLIWVIPTTGDPDPDGGPSVAAVEHYLENTGNNVPSPFSQRSFPFTATGYFKRQLGLTWDQITSQWQDTNFRWNDRFFAASFPLNMAGDQDGKIYTINTNQNADGAALASFVTFSRRAISDGRMRGLLTRVYPFVDQFTTPINVIALMSDSADGNPLITDTQSFDQTQPEGGHFTVHYRRGRYFEIKLSTDGPNAPWQIAGYDTDVRPGGRR